MLLGPGPFIIKLSLRYISEWLSFFARTYSKIKHELCQKSFICYMYLLVAGLKTAANMYIDQIVLDILILQFPTYFDILQRME